MNNVYAPAAEITQKTRLSPEETAVLEFLKSRLGRVVTRVEVQAAVWPGRENIAAGAVDRLVGSIRRKLEGRVSVQTFYGAGYILIR